jgi:hypothetical protein
VQYLVITKDLELKIAVKDWDWLVLPISGNEIKLNFSMK